MAAEGDMGREKIKTRSGERRRANECGATNIWRDSPIKVCSAFFERACLSVCERRGGVGGLLV